MPRTAERKQMPWDMRLAFWLIRRKQDKYQIQGQINLRWDPGYWNSSSQFFGFYLQPSKIEKSKDG